MTANYLKNKRILLVDDEPELRNMVTSILSAEGFTNIRTAGTVKDAAAAAKEFHPEFAILDVMLPDGDGFSLMEELRRTAGYPVLFLTARGEDEDKFRGFRLGADDYMVKPFLPKELVFRITAILRRTYKDEDPSVTLKYCEIDFERAEVRRKTDTDGDTQYEALPLTAKEYAILHALYRNAGRIVTIDALCEAAWGDNPYGYENSLMAHIRRIREKIEAVPSKPESLITVKGLGYKLMIR